MAKLSLLVARSLILEPDLDDVLGQDELLRELFGLSRVRIRIALEVNVQSAFLLLRERGAHFFAIRSRQIEAVFALVILFILAGHLHILAIRIDGIKLVTAARVMIVMRGGIIGAESRIGHRFAATTGLCGTCGQILYAVKVNSRLFSDT